jgi:hypothetical protein
MKKSSPPPTRSSLGFYLAHPFESMHESGPTQIPVTGSLTRRSFIKRSVVAAVAVSSMTIFSGLVDASTSGSSGGVWQGGGPCQTGKRTASCSGNPNDQHMSGNGDLYSKCNSSTLGGAECACVWRPGVGPYKAGWECLGTTAWW